MYSLELETSHANPDTTNSYFAYIEEKLSREVEARASFADEHKGDGVIVVSFLDA